MSRDDAATALRRFGLGARPGEVARIAGDPRGFVAAQVARSAVLPEGDELDASHVTLAAQIAARRALEAQRKAAPGATPPVDAAPMAKPGRIRREAYAAETDARMTAALTTDAPLVERLVWFWANHFTVSGQKQLVRGIAGAFEREAIRPHVTGRFADMLRAAVQHPAMLIYLDNHLSIGPDSPVGRRRSRGLNENLAREVLELHTLGVDGGYTQEDVAQLARVLTGWSVGGLAGVDPDDGRFVFAPRRQEPGPFTVLGRTYSGEGVELASGVLDDLARHPATAHHVAGKLARHFVGDGASDALIGGLADTFRATDGDLGALVSFIVASEEAWSTPPRKILPPFDHLVAVGRGFGLSIKPSEVIRLTRALGQPLWMAPSPQGWSDADDAWTAPSGLIQRLKIAERAARDCPADPRRLAEDLLGGALTPETAQAIARAETRAQGLQLLAMSPEFQRR